MELVRYNKTRLSVKRWLTAVLICFSLKYPLAAEALLLFLWSWLNLIYSSTEVTGLYNASGYAANLSPSWKIKQHNGSMVGEGGNLVRLGCSITESWTKKFSFRLLFINRDISRTKHVSVTNSTFSVTVYKYVNSQKLHMKSCPNTVCITMLIKGR